MLTIQSQKFFCIIKSYLMSFTPGSTRFHRLFQAFYSWKVDSNCTIWAQQDDSNRLCAGERWDEGGTSFFLMKNLRRHVTPGQDVCMISEIHESIKSAYNNPLNGCHGSRLTHVYYIWYIRQNFLTGIKDRDLKEIISNMGKHMCVCHDILKKLIHLTIFFSNSAWYAMNIPKFEYYRGEIQEANRKALAWVNNIPKENELECMTTVDVGVQRHKILSSHWTMCLRELATSLSQLLSNKPTIVWSVCLLIEHTRRMQWWVIVIHSHNIARRWFMKQWGKSNAYRVD